MGAGKNWSGNWVETEDRRSQLQVVLLSTQRGLVLSVFRKNFNLFPWQRPPYVWLASWARPLQRGLGKVLVPQVIGNRLRNHTAWRCYRNQGLQKSPLPNLSITVLKTQKVSNFPFWSHSTPHGNFFSQIFMIKIEQIILNWGFPGFSVSCQVYCQLSVLMPE